MTNHLEVNESRHVHVTNRRSSGPLQLQVQWVSLAIRDLGASLRWDWWMMSPPLERLRMEIWDTTPRLKRIFGGWHTVDGNQKSGKLTSWGKGSWNPIICRVLYFPGGCLGFLPSTVPLESCESRFGGAKNPPKNWGAQNLLKMTSTELFWIIPPTYTENSNIIWKIIQNDPNPSIAPMEKRLQWRIVTQPFSNMIMEEKLFWPRMTGRVLVDHHLEKDIPRWVEAIRNVSFRATSLQILAWKRYTKVTGSYPQCSFQSHKSTNPGVISFTCFCWEHLHIFCTCWGLANAVSCCACKYVFNRPIFL